MIIKGLDKKGKVRTVELDQEIIWLGKTTDDGKDVHVKGFKRYYIDGKLSTEKKALKLFKEINSGKWPK